MTGRAREIIGEAYRDMELNAISADDAVSAILARLTAAGYRILGPDADDPATAVYGQLLSRHLHAARNFQGERRDKLFDLAEAFRAEFPDECKVWDDRYSPEERAIRSLGGGET